MAGSIPPNGSSIPPLKALYIFLSNEISLSIPQWLQKYVEKVEDLNFFEDSIRPNHVLINEYLQGQGIMPHLDGPLFYPTVTTISCGSHTVLEFFSQRSDSVSEAEDISMPTSQEKSSNLKMFSILVERRSLLVLKDDMYTKYLHGIAETCDDIISEDLANLQQTEQKFKIGDELTRDTRISLTIRHVPKTTKLKINFIR
ncbi:alpha-ketoglutarate-dependent dioxygenase alkB homolog 6 [Nilaparvata lugens]|uniref:alpha-ketoglutarate-dependent dioxygenase alkB homolog 6 n=1 Tax=Nilaparvata lugens TaxID=108931 RepID=UPI00193DC7A8|nr:alpha-ketoglutarate-dependent dioxygenase alkB homolog 6 [Nilaparvata lugens]